MFAVRTGAVWALFSLLLWGVYGLNRPYLAVTYGTDRERICVLFSFVSSSLEVVVLLVYLSFLFLGYAGTGPQNVTILFSYYCFSSPAMVSWLPR
jgi:hypothetical protein